MRNKLLVLTYMLSISFFMVACGNVGKEVIRESEASSTVMSEEVSTASPETSKIPESVPKLAEPTETPATTEEPTPTPTETPTPEPVHEHSYTETIIKKCLHMMSGTKRYTCSCGYSYEEEFFHEGDGNRVVTKEPTCSSEGVSAEHCIYCGENLYGRSVPKTEHTPKSYWVCFTPTGDYYLECSICNHVITHTTTRPEGVEIREFAPIDSSTLQPIN